GPLGEMAGLKAPRPEDVGPVVLVVLPIHRPIGMVMLPDETLRQVCLAHGDVPRQGLCPLEVTTLAGRIVGSEHRLAAVHVRVLSPVRREPSPVCAGFVCLPSV